MDNRSLNYILGLVAIILALLQFRACQETNRAKGVLQAQSDTLKTYRNELGQHVAERKVLAGDYKSIKDLLNTKDSLLAEMAKKLNKNSASVTIFAGQTSSTTSSKTNQIAKADTVILNDTVVVYAEYTSDVQNQWEKYSIKANKDSITLTHTSFNKYSVEQNYVSQGWFKPKAIEMKITNYNPNTITVDAQSFLLPPKKEGRGLWIIGSFLAGLTTFAVLHR